MVTFEVGQKQLHHCHENGRKQNYSVRFCEHIKFLEWVNTVKKHVHEFVLFMGVHWTLACSDRYPY